jgi:hypothetical protein
MRDPDESKYQFKANIMLYWIGDAPHLGASILFSKAARITEADIVKKNLLTFVFCTLVLILGAEPVLAQSDGRPADPGYNRAESGDRDETSRGRAPRKKEYSNDFKDEKKGYQSDGERGYNQDDRRGQDDRDRDSVRKDRKSDRDDRKKDDRGRKDRTP